MHVTICEIVISYTKLQQISIHARIKLNNNTHKHNVMNQHQRMERE